MALPFLAFAYVILVAAACSDSDDGAKATPPADAGPVLQDSGAGDGHTDSETDAGDAAAKESLGAACGTESTKCTSGFCVDGVCCDQACTGQCMGCNSAGSIGKCTNIPRLEEDPSYVDDAGTSVDCTNAVGGSKCDGAGKCLRAGKVPCDDDASCLSGKCTGAGTKKCLGATGELCDALAECASNDCAAGVCK